MINPLLLEYEYYLKRMSMFLNESHGLKERVKILFDILKSIDDFYNELILKYDIKNIFNVSQKKYNERYDINNNSEDLNIWLDRIGSIFNIPRSQTIRTCALDVNGDYTNENPTSEADLDANAIKYITLTNDEYIEYIKLGISKFFFNGTREELAAIYGAENNQNQLFNFYYVTTYNLNNSQIETANVNIYWNNGSISSNITPTLKYMFLNGLLTIESLGITYERSIQNIEQLSYFAPDRVLTDNDYTLIGQITKEEYLGTETRKPYFFRKSGNNYVIATTYSSSTNYYICNYALWGKKINDEQSQGDLWG